MSEHVYVLMEDDWKNNICKGIYDTEEKARENASIDAYRYSGQTYSIVKCKMNELPSELPCTNLGTMQTRPNQRRVDD